MSAERPFKGCPKCGADAVSRRVAFEDAAVGYAEMVIVCQKCGVVGREAYEDGSFAYQIDERPLTKSARFSLPKVVTRRSSSVFCPICGKRICGKAQKFSGDFLAGNDSLVLKVRVEYQIHLECLLREPGADQFEKMLSIERRMRPTYQEMADRMLALETSALEVENQLRSHNEN